MRILNIYNIADCYFVPVMSGSGVQEVLADSAEDNKEEEKKEEMPDISETNNLGSSWTLLEKEEQDEDLQDQV